ncbi:RF-1 domain-containing protein, partial [Russula compacta]
SLPTPPPLSNLATSKDAAAAHDWLMRFRGCPIPRPAVDITFSRSSGPGGQNVNKVNTKATVRCALDSTWIPVWARDGLQQSPHFVKSTYSVLLTSSLHRSQAQNVDDCLSKLHALICSAASQPIQNEPSEQQRERVRELERKANAQRRLQKDKRSQTKRQRVNPRLDW